MPLTGFNLAALTDLHPPSTFFDAHHAERAARHYVFQPFADAIVGCTQMVVGLGACDAAASVV